MRSADAGAVLALALTVHTGWNVRRLRPAVDGMDPGAGETGSVSVVLPVRDEARQVRDCLDSVLALAAVTELIVVDDGSSDGTADRVPPGPRVRVLAGTPPPAGWLGKPWACAQGAAVATGEVLVFLDADVRLLAGFTPQLAGFALVSPYPRLLADGPLERLVQPLLPWSWLTFLPLGWAERSTRPALTAAGGQLLVVDAAAYRAVGGHGAVRGEVLEDVRLAQALRRAGFHTAVLDGSRVAECRMYDGPRSLVDGYAKSLHAAFGPVGSVAVAALLSTAYLAPWLGRSPLARLGVLAGVGGRVLTARRTGGRATDALGHPLSVLAFDALLAVSWWRRIRGSNRWKGRPV